MMCSAGAETSKLMAQTTIWFRTPCMHLLFPLMLEIFIRKQLHHAFFIVLHEGRHVGSVISELEHLGELRVTVATATTSNNSTAVNRVILSAET
eukprot:3173713-Amphidinium_carterae.1